MNNEELIINNEKLNVEAEALKSAQDIKYKTNAKPVGACIARPLRKNNGITLIALIITIIVMLILAGVVLSLTIGERGIFKTAQGAAKNYTNASDKELAGLNKLDNDINGILTGIGQGQTEESHVPTKLTSQITAADYGKTINYSANGVKDWKVFYNDGTNVYIITSDYLDNTKIDTNKTGFSLDGKYDIYIENNENVSEGVEILTNKSNWSEFATGVNGATAIGSPTIEMFINSWNTNPKTKSTILTLGGAQELTNATDLYLPHTSLIDGCWGYFLSSSQSDSMWGVFYTGDVAPGLNFYTGGYSIRPVVCLPSETTGTIGSTVTID